MIAHLLESSGAPSPIDFVIPTIVVTTNRTIGWLLLVPPVQGACVQYRRCQSVVTAQ